MAQTLKELRDEGYRLYAHCNAQYAGHGDWLKLDILIEKFGEDYVFLNDTRISNALRCTKCGHKGASIRLHPENDPDQVRKRIAEKIALKKYR